MDQLLRNNARWAEKIKQEDPQFFEQLAQGQSPEYLWIGCADSRVPASQVTGLLPGELFVHRNIANTVVHTDMNCMSVIQYAVQYLKVKHVIVCGHYGCGGVKASMDNKKLGLIDGWLNHIRDVQRTHNVTISCEADIDAKADYVCELNVLEQARNVCKTGAVLDAWETQQPLTVHTVIYGLHDGLLRDLGMNCSSPSELESVYQAALEGVRARYPQAAG